MIYNSIDFEELGYIMKTNKYDQTPDVRSSKQNVIGRDGDIIFTDGFNNKTISVILTAIDDGDIVLRRQNANVIRSILVKPGDLILDHEPTIVYNARILKGTTVKFNASYDEISVVFDVDPIATSRFDDSITWDEADIPWKYADFTWDGSGNEFTLSGTGQINIINNGNYESSCVYQISADGDVTFTHSNGDTFTYTGLNGTINIDTKNLVVYDDLLQNQIQNFTGDFISLDVGDNLIDITGTFTTLTLNVISKDAYV